MLQRKYKTTKQMVTIIHKDIDSVYENINNWIKSGITNDAVRLCPRQWRNQDILNRYSTIWEIRNYCWLGKTIKPLNKW